MKYADLPASVKARIKPPAKAKRSKYNAVRHTVAGIPFDSVHESKVYGELLLEAEARRRQGWIVVVHRQVTFDLPAGVRYVCDFLVVEIDPVGQRHVRYIDAKGMRTPVYKLKKRQVEGIYGVVIEER